MALFNCFRVVKKEDPCINCHADRIIILLKAVCMLVLLFNAGCNNPVLDSKQDRLLNEYKLKAKPNEGIHEFEIRNAFDNKGHLEVAKKLLNDPKALSQARQRLNFIDKNSAEYNEAKQLLSVLVAKENKAAEIARKHELEEEKERKEKEEAGLSSKGKRLRAKHPAWSIEDCDTISKGKINIGMTAEQVRAAWGRPYRVNRSTTAYGTSEQWVMHEHGNTYVYFEDGICVTVQN